MLRAFVIGNCFLFFLLNFQFVKYFWLMLKNSSKMVRLQNIRKKKRTSLTTRVIKEEKHFGYYTNRIYGYAFFLCVCLWYLVKLLNSKAIAFVLIPPAWSSEPDHHHCCCCCHFCFISITEIYVPKNHDKFYAMIMIS